MKAKLATVAAATIAVAACGSNNDEPVAPMFEEPVSTPDDIYESEFAPTLSMQEQLTQYAGADRVFFGFDESTLKDEAREVLRAQAEWMNQNPMVSVRVEGNCDERGTREYNLALGARRANAVRDFLVGLGVDPSRVTTISYGKDRPLDPASNELAWATNRNAHTFIVEDTFF